MILRPFIIIFLFWIVVFVVLTVIGDIINVSPILIRVLVSIGITVIIFPPM